MKILLAGTLAGVHAQGGATWAVAQYALGLADLGHEVLVVEPSERDPAVLAYFARATAALGLAGRAALVHPDRSATGLDYCDVLAWARTSDVLINLAGVLRDEELCGPVPRRVYIDLDPGFTQLWQAVEGVDMGFSGHDRFVTVGPALGTAACTVPTCGLTWTATLPPVVLRAWPALDDAPIYGVTTVANWRSYGSITHQGVHFGQKAHSLRHLLDLPRRVPGVVFEPALAIDPGEVRDVEGLIARGWRLLDPAYVTAGPDEYREFVQQSRAEIGVAKSGYVTSRCGWFSDRSACYLASGRPVVAQDTGWRDYLPAGEGLLAFDDVAEAGDGLVEILGNYRRHAKAAREIACEIFDSRRVLSALLERVDGGP
ncbi:MAG: hypothetical protein JWM55_1718 [Acidimicrobiaceae bacterium]|nr:hypothetical protein [Acidimicrobiaceae bacterium]